MSLLVLHRPGAFLERKNRGRGKFPILQRQTTFPLAALRTGDDLASGESHNG
jgi:hypothetical protein